MCLYIKLRKVISHIVDALHLEICKEFLFLKYQCRVENTYSKIFLNYFWFCLGLRNVMEYTSFPLCRRTGRSRKLDTKRPEGIQKHSLTYWQRFNWGTNLSDGKCILLSSYIMQTSYFLPKGKVDTHNHFYIIT